MTLIDDSVQLRDDLLQVVLCFSARATAKLGSLPTLGIYFSVTR